MTKIIGLIILFWISIAGATTYKLDNLEQRIVGKIQYVKAKQQDTLLDIARKYDLGFNEITDANPGIDPWLPKEGERVLLPTRFILPDAPRKGIVVNLAEMRLYYYPVSENGIPDKVITHPIGIGRQGWDTPKGEYHIIMKLEKPNWTMPLSVYEEELANGERPKRIVPPGPKNPLGEFALQLNTDNLLLHGTNMPFSIGMRVSRGCLRLYPEDIRSMVKVVPKGTEVKILEQPYKFSYEDNILYLESHKAVGVAKRNENKYLRPIITRLLRGVVANVSDEYQDQVVRIAGLHSGIPTPVEVTIPDRNELLSAVTLPAPFTESEY
jgi:L,D-transpeptidase ErfK/SrfK